VIAPSGEAVAFARVSAWLNPPPRPPAGIHPAATVAADAEVAADASIAAGAVIGSGARIGARTVVGPNCTVGEQARIGADCLLHANVTSITVAKWVTAPSCIQDASSVGTVLAPPNLAAGKSRRLAAC
jgi:UDP-3-O-[3-hydroxymyristoyl] glucosamine N-acyltransferase